jgi:MoaA/NifB/PqqE/SkfB family radical SAM enzyme
MGYECNNSCSFCINSYKRDYESKSTATIMQEMAVARKQGNTYLELIGGEPTIRPDILDIISFGKKLKFRYIVMATNGRLFSYNDFARRIVGAGLTDLIFSIHGDTPELHDSLTRAKGSFKQLMKGIENIRSAGLWKIGSNTTIVKQNYRRLEKIGKLIRSLGINNAEFIFVDPEKGEISDNFHTYVPKISKAAPYMRKTLALAQEKTSNWNVRYVPLCYFTNHIHQVSELKELEFFNTQHLAPDFINLDVVESRKNISRKKTKKCIGCDLFDSCEGIWRKYLECYGDGELKPICNVS